MVQKVKTFQNDSHEFILLILHEFMLLILIIANGGFKKKEKWENQKKTDFVSQQLK
jgi:hypothetical protein